MSLDVMIKKYERAVRIDIAIIAMLTVLLVSSLFSLAFVLFSAIFIVTMFILVLASFDISTLHVLRGLRIIENECKNNKKR